MLLCDLSLATPEENLACDEALLEESEAGGTGELLRFWEPEQYFIVLGYANKQATEVNVDFCRRNEIPILRRCSGGGTVLQGPGCLNFTLILWVDGEPGRQSISGTNDEVLTKHQTVLEHLLQAPVEKQGHTDLAICSRKFSGNAQRRKLHFLLFHGCFLLNLDLGLVEQALLMPSQRPDYRTNRSHLDFLTNLRVRPADVKAALTQAWNAAEPMGAIPRERIQMLRREKYGQAAWNLRF